MIVSSNCLESEGKSELRVEAEHGCGGGRETLGSAGTGDSRWGTGKS